MTKVIVSLDIGGTNMRACMYGATSSRELGRVTIPSNGENYRESLRDIIAAIQSLVGDHVIVAIGVGVAGAVSEDGRIIGSGNLPNWVGYSLRDDLESRFDVPVIVLNDCAAAALGEYTAFHKALIYVIWGTGIGVAIVFILNGEVHVRSTELGHMVIDRKGKFKCGCGGFGHLEALISGCNIPKRFRRFFSRKGRKAEELNDRQWTKVLRDMAFGLRNLSAGDMHYPIVLGGGVSNKQAKRLPQLQTMVNELESTCPPPKLFLAKHGEDSGLVGAAHAARQLIAA